MNRRIALLLTLVPACIDSSQLGSADAGSGSDGGRGADQGAGAKGCGGPAVADPPTPLSFALSAAASVPIGMNPSSIAAGDFNGDGKLDLAVSNGPMMMRRISVFPGHGDGTFGAARDTAQFPNINGFLVADANRDGHADLIVPSDTTLYALLGGGDGSFGQPIASAMGTSTRYAEVADFNGDGRPDVLALPQLMLGVGDGTFMKGTPLLPSRFHVVADWNCDGHPDVALYDVASNGLFIYLGQGDGNFGAPVRPAIINIIGSPTAGDVSGDGKLDFVVLSGNSSTLAAYLGRGNGDFGREMQFHSGGMAGQVQLADLDRDGKLDAIGSATGLFVALGRGDGTFQDAVSVNVPQGTTPTFAVIADWNGDQKPDLAFTDNTGNAVYVVMNTSR